ncbi:7,8-dihydropterin-6-yl-methyl-4-(beta-D-ribofuranosyl)aminobenzene 5'-phosphate synthase [Malonomonas rubra DSM 5091]|uniref:7,8-dihydropterin-6-yl-methyl-4-(Beta-D-ribofuranosyl)aminobenzene 5'-phosphate synthase n=1 Tax=Malonomonas rubra DSM 5091 TaxID=1122189 RepID=A0A1M6JBI5_MALRU|nr:MBL fold metallo-hydrolase [Malonomonas rubra]SHJ44051.1 7,8-dihydropterin-6-yl-methyl-4-(beta-D-ribofuranosyl)aminobenzene 5'-phosphate synthase [Malonomonas rubra DSM 5091]
MSDNMKRRDFLKGATTGVGLGMLGAMGIYSYSPLRKQHFPEVARKMTDIGVCKSVNVTNISETSWFENATLMGDIKGAGGLLVNQYDYNWPPFGNGKGLGKGSYDDGMAKIKHLLPDKIDEAWQVCVENCVHPENAGGYAALIDVEEMSGKHRKFLLDSGWGYAWTDECFKREGIDKMLANREIEALFFSHEHFDHFWGLPVTLKYDPTITIYIPEGFYPEGLQYIKDSGHKGKVVTVPKGLNPHIPGMATYVFGIPIICRVYGEQSMYFNVKDKGLVSVTGCCHQGIIRFAETAYNEIKYENDNFYGIYGGLHISPFDDWDPKYDDLVISLKNYGFEQIGCNHCTGVLCAKKFVAAGYNVIEGTAQHRSKDKVYLGNGDKISFG